MYKHVIIALTLLLYRGICIYAYATIPADLDSIQNKGCVHKYAVSFRCMHGRYFTS